MYYRHSNTAQSCDSGSENAMSAVPVQENTADAREADFGLMQAHYGKLGKQLLPYVKAAVENNMYEGSPLLRDIGPDRASLDKTVNETLDAVCKCFDEAEEICLENRLEGWSAFRLLHGLTESLVLAEIFLKKRLQSQK